MKVLIYIGYQQRDLEYQDVIDGNEIGGTELVALNLAENLAKWGIETFFGGQIKSGFYNNVEWLNLTDCSSKHFDMVISASYMHFIDKIDAKYKLLWMHNTDFYDWYKGERVYGIEYMQRQDLNGIIALTEWHKKQIEKDYNPICPIYVIGNAIDRKTFPGHQQKTPGSFIYSSAAERGLNRVLEMWPQIQATIPDATLNVFTPGYSLPLVNKWPEGVTFRGTANQETLHKWQAQSEYWFYPTKYEETYCITALEMQMNKVIPITSNVAALDEVVVNKSGKLSGDETNEKYLDIIKELHTSPERKQKIRINGWEWAKQQTWNVRIQEWIQLINSYAN